MRRALIIGITSKTTFDGLVTMMMDSDVLLAEQEARLLSVQVSAPQSVST